MPQELTVLEILVDREQWSPNFLSWDRRIARIDIVGGRSGFRPFRLWQRWLNPAFLPLDCVIRTNCNVRFSEVVASDRAWAGFIEPSHENQRWSSLPLETWLDVVAVHDFDFEVFHGGNSWRISNITLTYLTEVRIRTSRYD